jgi:hypothetical protein
MSLIRIRCHHNDHIIPFKEVDMIVKSSLRLMAGALLVLSLALAGTANAKTFTMSGQWYMNRGALVDIPINGGAVFCQGASLQEGCVGVFKPLNGGVPGGAVITPTNIGPANFTIPPHAFGQALGSQRVPISIAPTVVQLVTSFVYDGPADFTQAGLAVPTFTVNQNAKFRKNAWSKDPGQAGRVAANFAWCPGVGGPGCASGLAATPAAVQGIVKYTAGANAFGGTMAMIIDGTGATSIVAGVGALPTGGAGTTMVPLLAHLPIAGMGVNPQVGGVGYAFRNTVMLGAAPKFLGFMTSATGGKGLITSTGPPLLTGGGNPDVQAGDTNINWGFPWTTGTISVMNTEITPGGNGTGTLTAMGSDSRNAAGGGRITLVAGSTNNRVLSGLDFEALEVLVLDFEGIGEVPSMGPAGLATVGLLMALSAGYAIRGRFASKK